MTHAMQLFQPFQQPLQFGVEVVVATDAEIFAYAATVGGDGLVVGDAVELEQFSQAVEVPIGEANGLLVGQPLIDIIVIGVAALGGAFSSDEDELHVITIGYSGTKVFARLDSGAAGAARHAPEVYDEKTTGELGVEIPDKFSLGHVRQARKEFSLRQSAVAELLGLLADVGVLQGIEIKREQPIEQISGIAPSVKLLSHFLIDAHLCCQVFPVRTHELAQGSKVVGEFALVPVFPDGLGILDAVLQKEETAAGEEQRIVVVDAAHGGVSLVVKILLPFSAVEYLGVLRVTGGRFFCYIARVDVTKEPSPCYTAIMVSNTVIIVFFFIFALYDFLNPSAKVQRIIEIHSTKPHLLCYFCLMYFFSPLTKLLSTDHSLGIQKLFSTSAIAT